MSIRVRAGVVICAVVAVALLVAAVVVAPSEAAAWVGGSAAMAVGAGAALPFVASGRAPERGGVAAAAGVIASGLTWALWPEDTRVAAAPSYRVRLARPVPDDAASVRAPITDRNMTLCSAEARTPPAPGTPSPWAATPVDRHDPGWTPQSTVCTGVPGRTDFETRVHLQHYDASHYDRTTSRAWTPQQATPHQVGNMTGAGCFAVCDDDEKDDRSRSSSAPRRAAANATKAAATTTTTAPLGAKATRLAPLFVGTDEWRDGSYRVALVAVHKIWGYVGGTWEHGGVSKRNIFVHDDPITGRPVLRLRITGDLCDPRGKDPNHPDHPLAPALEEAPHQKKRRRCREMTSGDMVLCKTDDGDAKDASAAQKTTTTTKAGKRGDACGPMGRECFTEIRCQPYAEKTADSDGFAHPPPAAGAGAGKNIFARCGACFATRQVFGPGVFTVRARLNPTAWKEMGGRGYVFAAWTFSYGEVYALQSEGGAPQARQAPRGTYCYNDCSCEGDSSCDATFDGKPCVPGQRKLADHPYFKGAPPASASDPRPPADYRAVCSGDVLYAALNHEIDIEIPANSPGLDWTKDLTWSTMNCNTWVGDIDYYDGSMPWYSQAMVELKKEQPNFADGQFHDFTIDWYVDRHDATKSYVKFLVDGRVLYVTRRFVPTRSGRLVVGPWPGWWGSGRDASGAQQAPAFDVGYVDIAALTINPYSPATCDVQIRTFPQTFDQILPAGVQTVECSPVGAAAGTSAAQQVQCAIQCDYREIGADDVQLASAGPVAAATTGLQVLTLRRPLGRRLPAGTFVTQDGTLSRGFLASATAAADTTLRVVVTHGPAAGFAATTVALPPEPPTFHVGPGGVCVPVPPNAAAIETTTTFRDPFCGGTATDDASTRAQPLATPRRAAGVATAAIGTAALLLLLLRLRWRGTP